MVAAVGVEFEKLFISDDSVFILPLELPNSLYYKSPTCHSFSFVFDTCYLPCPSVILFSYTTNVWVGGDVVVGRGRKRGMEAGISQLKI